MIYMLDWGTFLCYLCKIYILFGDFHFRCPTTTRHSSNNGHPFEGSLTFSYLLKKSTSFRATVSYDRHTNHYIVVTSTPYYVEPNVTSSPPYSLQLFLRTLQTKPKQRHTRKMFNPLTLILPLTTPDLQTYWEKFKYTTSGLEISLP